MKPRSTPALWLRRLDFLPPRAAWALGLGGGALAGAAFAGVAPGTVGVLGFLALLGAAAGLAASGKPIAVVEQAGPDVSPPLLNLVKIPENGEPVTEPERPSVDLTSLVADLEIVEIPGGSFQMGSPRDERGSFGDEGPVHEVQISPFTCMRLPVTRRLYAGVMSQDPGLPEGDADDRPANNVSWFDAIKFCNLLSEQAGLEPCYRNEGEQVQWNQAASGYRLLTEAEWEYACRAGTLTPFSFGDDEKQLRDYSWFNTNSSHRPNPVGRKLPNPWGLYDMHGNVWEWCWDWFGPYTTTERQVDPAGPPYGTSRTARGGSFIFGPRILRSGSRFKFPPAYRDEIIGFRCGRSGSR